MARLRHEAATSAPRIRISRYVWNLERTLRITNLEQLISKMTYSLPGRKWVKCTVWAATFTAAFAGIITSSGKGENRPKVKKTYYSYPRWISASPWLMSGWLLMQMTCPSAGARTLRSNSP